MRLVELLESETATLGEVETLLKVEPVLCGKVLQIATPLTMACRGRSARSNRR
jgi:hypothetical protein